MPTARTTHVAELQELMTTEVRLTLLFPTNLLQPIKSPRSSLLSSRSKRITTEAVGETALLEYHARPTEGLRDHGQHREKGFLGTALAGGVNQKITRGRHVQSIRNCLLKMAERFQLE